MKEITVIGAGIAGLTAALRLQYDGYKVTIYEKREQVGGKMNQIKAKGFTFDLGPTIVMMHDIYNENLAYTGVNPKDYIEFEQLNPMYNVTFSDGEKIVAHNDLPTMIEALEKRSLRTANEYLDYLNQTYKKYVVAKEHFIERSFRKPSDFYNLKTIRQALKLRTLDSAQHTINKFVKDEKIQKMIAFHTLYIGMSPKKGPSIYTIIPMIETMYGVSYSKGGMYSYVKAIEKRFLELGGTIKTKQNVEEILFENKVAYGIKVNGKIIQSDAVICNADFPWAMNNLVKDPKVKGKYTEKKIKKMAYSCSVMILYIGLKKKVPTLDVHNLYFGNDFEQNVSEIFSGHLPSDPAFYIYSPSQIDETVAPKDKELLYVLVPVPELKTSELSWDESVTNLYKEKLLDKLEKLEGLEDIRTQIDYLEVMTPNRFSNELNAMYGATFGLAPTLLQSNYYRPKNVYPYAKNLYFAGSSVHPGAGVPIAITSGKLVHKEVKKDFE